MTKAQNNSHPLALDRKLARFEQLAVQRGYHTIESYYHQKRALRALAKELGLK